jgi:Rieske Fe-S protein
MCPNRREFLLLSATAAVGCAARLGGVGAVDQSISQKSVSIDAGSAGNFCADGVYDQFAHQGFFIVRKGDRLIAISSLCTHRRHELEVLSDKSFYCEAHGSCFNPAGKVTQGPATRDLPVLPSRIDERGHLMILGLAGPAT